MSIQSANSDVLKNMKRNYGQDEVIHSLKRIQERVPGAFVGMDVIVGFPTETKEQFEDTYATLAALPWSKIHVFPYSERQGTRAAVMESSVPKEERARRAAKLRELSLQRYEHQAQAQIGKVKKALILKGVARGGQGLTEDYWPVDITGADAFLEAWSGQEILVKVSGYDHSNKQHMEGHLVAEVMSD